MDDRYATNDENTPIVTTTSTTPRAGLLDPRGPYLRWIAVFFMCFLSFGKKIISFTWSERKRFTLV